MCIPKFDFRRILLLVVACCLVLPVPVLGQEPEASEDAPADKVPLRTVIKQTRHIEVEDLQPILQMLDVKIRLAPDVNAIVLRGRPNDIETALALVENLDVPPEPRPSVEVAVFVVSASRDEIPGSNIPAGLESAVGQLREIFGYQGFGLLDTVFLRVRDGRPGRLEGGIALGESGEIRTGYQLTFHRVDVIPREEGPRIIRLDRLQFELEGTHGGEIQRASLRTDVEVREGQKAVIGKSTPQGTDSTLILIVEATVLE